MIESTQSLRGKSPRVRCLHCNQLRSANSLKPRGLCKPCYQDEDIREAYPYRPRGNWHPTSRSWTVEESAFLMELYELGFSDRQIATRLGRSEGSIQKRRQQLSLPVSVQRQGEHRTRRYREQQHALCDAR